jgi:hypothetical protein
MAKQRDKEIVELAEEILRNIELDEIPLRNTLLKCARLARLTGSENAINLFNYELNGYPKDEKGLVLYKAFDLSRHVNRPFKKKDDFGTEKEYMISETVAELEAELETAKTQMSVAHDRDISVSSSNPQQFVYTPLGNTMERTTLKQSIIEKSRKLQLLKNGYYSYVLSVYNERRLEDITENIFQKKKFLVDERLTKDVPEAIQKFVAVYENLKSDNSEDWANAVHSCRRIIKDVADMLYPASDVDIDIGGGQTIKLSDDKYIARLKQYIKEKSDSGKFTAVVGSHLDYIGDRIDSLYRSSNKGTHDKVEQDEAERYVIYTYLLLADVLSL